MNASDLSFSERQLLLERARAVFGEDAVRHQCVSVDGEDLLLNAILREQGPAENPAPGNFFDKMLADLTNLKDLVKLCLCAPVLGAFLGMVLVSHQLYGWLLLEGLAYLVVVGPICWAFGSFVGLANAVGSWLVGVGMIAEGLFKWSFI